MVGTCPALRAAETEQVVVNRFSGLAIDGFDPVAYFTDAEPAKGAPDVEVSENGAIWRFRNEANRAAFVARPDIYGPQFGGYDPIDVARGKAVAGRAQLWLVSGGRLYLFSREESLAAFAANPANTLKLATSEWGTLRAMLADY
ncbi:YHS domain-containing (seleno)protein [Bradyrhizobium sp. SYSU BS000235]|uniref:YHS domain-containing (seleno)protein n=1 Tax=Bradyrhizobium sp. SYSU BS000235 TaxID=3411332 RepID=UPI003C770776